MAKTWTSVELTTLCSNPQGGTLLLPSDRQPPGRVLLLRKGESIRLIKAGLRSDPGTAACADASVVSQMAGQDGRVDYAAAGAWDVLRYSAAAQLQLAIAVLTFASAVLAAIVGFFSNSASTTNPFAAQAAFVILVIATGLAILKLVKDWRDAFTAT